MHTRSKRALPVQDGRLQVLTLLRRRIDDNLIRSLISRSLRMSRKPGERRFVDADDGSAVAARKIVGFAPEEKKRGHERQKPYSRSVQRRSVGGRGPPLLVETATKRTTKIRSTFISQSRDMIVMAVTRL